MIILFYFLKYIMWKQRDTCFSLFFEYEIERFILFLVSHLVVSRNSWKKKCEKKSANKMKKGKTFFYFYTNSEFLWSRATLKPFGFAKDKAYGPSVHPTWHPGHHWFRFFFSISFCFLAASLIADEVGELFLCRSPPITRGLIEIVGDVESSSSSPLLE